MNYGNRIYGMWTESTAHLTQRQSRGREIPWRTGKLIAKQTCHTSNNNCSISLGSATKGIYIITITNNKNESITKKIVLQ
jgi:hypothetical protein